ncbi:MAG: A24 family peptidase [Candidatus Loosdrechtia sp.]|uniref:A24 family peptidase n=1 Tax=Candidatus Loosdrechtia sp. TaxID=3101272 RepID=UPI003A667A86|nr:MAG: A24 family peptidase [Candidatus Jettenia sp. AMX2]
MPTTNITNIIEITPILLLAATLFIAVVYDLRFQKIPNWITFPVMAAGVAFHTVTTGVQGLAFSAGGVFTGIAVFMPFYLFSGMGAGDVKLMGAIGGLLGMKGVLTAAIGTSLAGGVYAVILLAFHGQLVETVKRYGQMLKEFLFTRRFVYYPPEKKERMPMLCYGVAIACGTTLSLVINIV